jgi:hypothetical protein
LRQSKKWNDTMATAAQGRFLASISFFAWILRSSRIVNAQWTSKRVFALLKNC